MVDSSKPAYRTGSTVRLSAPGEALVYYTRNNGKVGKIVGNPSFNAPTKFRGINENWEKDQTWLYSLQIEGEDETLDECQQEWLEPA